MVLTGIPTKKEYILGLAWLCATIVAGPALKAALKPVSLEKSQESFPDMPVFHIFTDEEIRQDFLRIQFDKPLDRPELGFQLLIPKTWDEVPLTVSLDQLEHDDENIISLALLRAPDKEAQVEIAYCRVPQTVKLEEWARAYQEGNSLEALYVQTGTFSGRQVFDTLLKAPGDFKVRMTFSRHGETIYVISGSAPASLYEKYMKVFGLAVVSFQKL
jgi:hypothetical protein